MAEGDPEVISPQSDELPKTQSIVINQFIQLVNKSNVLPEGESLARYTNEDKEWIKERVQYEQEQRIEIINRLIANQQEMALSDNDHRHRNDRHRQTGAVIIISVAVIVCGILLFLKVGVLALGVPAVIMIAPVAGTVSAFVTERLKGETKKDLDKSPASATISK
jgi:hypothetical protein